MNPEFVRNPYNYDSDELSQLTGLECKDESLTEQEHLEETDINYIAERFMKTGMAPQVLDMPTYGDFEGVFDFQSALNLINAAKHEFMSLPAKLRTRFNNDPAELLNFLEDPQNREEAIKLGMVKPPEPDTIDPLFNQPENDNGRESRSTTQGDTKERSRTGGTQTATREGQATEKS